MSSIIIAGFALAIAAAVRGLWSPCGLSMISTITPMTERSRGNRFAVTALWFVLGGVLGGATLGLLTALGAAGVGALGLSTTTRAGIIAALAVVTIASDVRIAGWSLWNHPRQVDETWLGRMRSWAYAAGFGWQIGTGVATYVMTAGVYLLVVVALMSGSPWFALAVGAAFGFVRGLGVYAAARVTTPERLRALHQRIESLEATSRVVAVFGQLVVVALVVTVLPVGVAAVLGALAAGVALVGFAAGRRSACPVESGTAARPSPSAS